ncbi:MAG: VWA domain-containing protein [Planctomycetales bacterium]|nr:VWA domain-containing protein [Planctomycetales bacterium]
MKRFVENPTDVIVEGKTDLANLAPRTTVSILVDCSMSMEPHVPKLHLASQEFLKALDGSWVTRDTVEIGFYHFATNIIGQDLTPAYHYLNHALPESISGITNLGHALEVVLDLRKRRSEILREAGIGLRPGVLVLLSDGEVTDDVNKSLKRLDQLRQEQRFEILPIAVHPSHAETLQHLFQTQVVRLEEFDFSQFFRNLAGAISISSQSQLGHEPNIQLLIEQQDRQAKRMVRFTAKPNSDHSPRRPEPRFDSFRRLPGTDDATDA